uniref:Inositol polyphosphate-4-phosphatase type II B n=1 Tax=Scleropages formosus TaxID=113540 RepID=A0A8C9SP80_SCLFO
MEVFPIRLSFHTSNYYEGRAINPINKWVEFVHSWEPLGSHILPGVKCNTVAALKAGRGPRGMVPQWLTASDSPHCCACASASQGTRDPLFLTGVSFPPDYPLCEETRLQLTIYDVRDLKHDGVLLHFLKKFSVCSQRSFLGCTTFTVGDLLKSKDEQLTLRLRTSDGTSTTGTIVVSRLKMGEIEDGEMDQIAADVHGQKVMSTSTAVICCKTEKYLEFIPINLHTQTMQVTCPKHPEASYDIVTVGAPAAHYQGFKNGGLQRLLNRFEAEKKNTAYQCIYYSPENTAKAREVLASVSQLQPLISDMADQLLQAAQQRSPDRLQEALKTLCDRTEQFVHALKDELVKSALLALHAARPGFIQSVQPGTCSSVGGSEAQDSIPQHKDYDEEEWDRVWANVAKSLNCIIAMVDRLQEHDNNNEEPPAEPALADVITSHTPDAGDWQEKIYPLVVTLKDCVMEVVERAKKAMAFVLLQEVACSIPQGLALRQRRDVIFSQALAALACGFVMRLYTAIEDKGFLQQLQQVGVVAQFESLLSTYSEEIGMLEDMEVGIADLRRVTFKITEAKSGDALPFFRDYYTVEVPLPCGLFETLPKEIKDKPLHIYPVLFNVGINQQQTLAERFGDISLQERINQKNFEILDNYYKLLSDKMPLECLPSFQTQTNLKELLETLAQHVVTKKRKNVEILWLAGTICRRLNGIRFTSCKSAKDRTSMSVTLEQCSLLRDEHELKKEHFVRALDCMRREGCRIENVQKNVKCRKYAFNVLQLMAFPKCYRPPDGTYGKAET